MALASVELHTLVSEPDALTTRPSALLQKVNTFISRKLFRKFYLIIYLWFLRLHLYQICIALFKGYFILHHRE